MRIEVDWDRCEGNAVCQGVAPEVFEVDEKDYLHLLMEEIPAELVDRVQQAVRGCPKAALKLVE